MHSLFTDMCLGEFEICVYITKHWPIDIETMWKVSTYTNSNFPGFIPRWPRSQQPTDLSGIKLIP